MASKIPLYGVFSHFSSFPIIFRHLTFSYFFTGKALLIHNNNVPLQAVTERDLVISINRINFKILKK